MNKITIRMSESEPVKIDDEKWPTIATASWYNGRHECQANTIRVLRVRQHSDGRYLVYGYQEAGPGGQHIGTRNPYAGYMVDSIDKVVSAIRRVAGVLEDGDLGNDCIADLPAREI